MAVIRITLDRALVFGKILQAFLFFCISFKEES